MSASSALSQCCQLTGHARFSAIDPALCLDDPGVIKSDAFDDVTTKLPFPRRHVSKCSGIV